MTDITIPPEAVEAAARALMATGTYRYKELAEDDATAALLAGLKAWPGAVERHSWDGSLGRIILPLPTEVS